MNKFNIALGTALLALVVALGVYFVQPTQKVITEVKQSLGAVSGPDISSPYFSVNGLRFWSYRQASQDSTTTPCVFKLPAATSTLVSSAGNFTLYGTSTYFELGWDSSTYGATTTRIGVAGATGITYANYTITASTTAINPGTSAAASTSPQTTIFPPNGWLSYKFAGGTAGTLWFGATTTKPYCSLLLQEL